MRRRFLVAAAALLPLLLGVPATAQTAAQNTPQALKATYDQAMQAKDWPAAVVAAQQLVGRERHIGKSVPAGKRATLRGRSGRNRSPPMTAPSPQHSRRSPQRASRILRGKTACRGSISGRAMLCSS